MSEEHITSTPPPPSELGLPSSEKAPHSPPSSKDFWRRFLIVTALQAALGLLAGIVTFLVLYFLEGETRAARGWALVVALISFLGARSVIHWPVSHDTDEGKKSEDGNAYRLHVINMLVHLGVAFLTGVLFALVGFIARANARYVVGISVCAGIVVYNIVSRYVHWPLPKPIAAPKPQTPPNVRPSDAGGREIVETVVFVVVLVLLLKSFAAEAFVIPTGSMAETLYGNQKMVKCPSCSHTFPVNCSDEVDPPDGHRIVVTDCTCPNCRLPIRFVDPERKVPLKPNEVPDPGPSTGDRVLVAKFLYDTGLPGTRTPDRLDVVVFKFPGKSDEMGPETPLVEGPQKNHVAMNYIKRLVGLSGETIGIRGGDLYVLPAKNGPSYNDAATNRATDLWKKTPFMHENDPAMLNLWQKDPASFQIIRKPPRVLLSMMRIVYDNDHQAQDLKAKKEFQRWRTEGDGWESLDEGKAFRHGARAEPGEEGWLRYYHVLRGDGGEQSLITDFLGYNSNMPRRSSDFNGTNWVGDLILESEVNVEKPTGELTMELVRCGEKFRAVFSFGEFGGHCTLFRVTEAEKAIRIGDPMPVKIGKGTHRLRFANVDRRLTVWVDNELPFEEGESYEVLPDRGPTALDKQPAGIGVKGTAVTVRSLKLFRDSYHAVDTRADVHITNWKDPREWADLKTPPSKTLYVQPGHYLCLGDNSLQSSDGRTWGLVPQRLLLGRALLVYFPFNRAGRIR